MCIFAVKTAIASGSAANGTLFIHLLVGVTAFMRVCLLLCHAQLLNSARNCARKPMPHVPKAKSRPLRDSEMLRSKPKWLANPWDGHRPAVLTHGTHCHLCPLLLCALIGAARQTKHQTMPPTNTCDDMALKGKVCFCWLFFVLAWIGRWEKKQFNTTEPRSLALVCVLLLLTASFLCAEQGCQVGLLGAGCRILICL